MSGFRLTDGGGGPGASPPPVSARLIPFSDCPTKPSGMRGPLGCRGRKLQRPLIRGEEFDAIGLLLRNFIQPPKGSFSPSEGLC